MNFRMIVPLGAVLACAFVPGMVAANPIEPAPACTGPIEFDGRHYEVVRANGITWDAAKAAAEAKEFEDTGVHGHLATLTSSAEDAFVESLRQCARQRPDEPLSRDAVWVGGVQDESCPIADPECGWHWVNDEGPISTDNDSGSYSNWLPDEPNNFQGTNERHLTIGHQGNFGWNDEGNLNNIGGYVIEYDTSSIISVVNCIGTGCPLISVGQFPALTLTLPPGVNEDGEIGVRAYEFTDIPGRCGNEPLILFKDPDPRPELHIPAYLCGSPNFLVVEVTPSEDWAIEEGTALIETDPTVAMPGNWYDCEGLVNPGGLAPPDPQGRDVVAYQKRNWQDMRESSQLAGSIDPRFVGALGEFTFECGSSRGLVWAASYYVTGLYAFSGEAFADHPAHVFDFFVSLTRYKLLLLQAAVEDSRLTIDNGDYTVLRTHLRNARRFHERNDFASALQSIEVFLEKVASAEYQASAQNFGGEHLARARNIRFMYVEKVLPFAP